MTYRIIIRRRPEVPDAPGDTITTSLRALGFASVQRATPAKLIELQVDDNTSEAEIATMCEKLLTNPTIETYEIIAAS